MDQPGTPGWRKAETAPEIDIDIDIDGGVGVGVDLDGARTGTRAAVLIGGDPATGKSTLAAALAPRLGATLLDLDVATAPLMDVIAAQTGLTDLSNPRLAALTRDARYQTLFDLAEANLSIGRPVVLVAPFTAERRDPVSWQTVRDRLAAAGAQVSLVWLHLPRADLVARMRARGADRDGDKLTDTEAYLAGLHLGPPVGPHLALDAGLASPDLVEAILAHLAG